MTGSRSEIVFEALPVDDPQVRQPDITRAKQVLGWEPQVSLRDGLKRTIDEAGRRDPGRPPTDQRGSPCGTRCAFVYNPLTHDARVFREAATLRPGGPHVVRSSG